MSLEKQIADFLVRAEALPAASKLEPYAELIRQLRQRRWTYQQIAAALRGEFGVSVVSSTIHAFIKVRAKKKDVPALSAPAPLLPIAVKSGGSISTHRRSPPSASPVRRASLR